MNSIDPPSREAANAIAELRSHDQRMEQRASDLAHLLAARIRHADNASLKVLKLALRNYNVHTGAWKDTPQK